ncbi:hypothetical protein BT96DRAFT_940619 [Gymnopus androsaceus JB14]|uniref:Uncharacterized protein n=1 Tax=Gymnopus androsaceus JB14 TaxID=1447944 RepID=A0A6A4HLD7_9AGAR|nr:hypothetical protein BT96DRAFT_940619 [Gymnopus androsaceus JB14]
MYRLQPRFGLGTRLGAETGTEAASLVVNAQPMVIMASTLNCTPERVILGRTRSERRLFGLGAYLYEVTWYLPHIRFHRFDTMSSEQQSGPLSDADLYALKEWIAETAHRNLQIANLANRDRGVNNSSRFILLVVTVIMFLNSTALVILDLEFTLVQVPFTGFNPPNLVKAMKLLGNIKIAGNFFARLNFLINDSIVIWRAWILCPHNRVVKLILSISLLACYACSIFDAANGAAAGAGTKEFLVLDLPSLFTNITATSLVTYKAWYHGKDIQCILNSGSRTTKVQKILSLLIESGSVYISFWIAATFLTAFGDSTLLSFQVFIASALPYLSALYPIIIILLVALENNKIDNRAAFSLSQSLRLATEARTRGASSNGSDSSEAVSYSIENQRHGGIGKEIGSV